MLKMLTRVPHTPKYSEEILLHAHYYGLHAFPFTLPHSQLREQTF